MSAPRYAARGRGKGKGRAAPSSQNAIPEVFQEMLADAIPLQSDVPERPLKKRRTGRRGDPVPVVDSGNPINDKKVEDEEDLEFEDIPGLYKGKETADDDGPHKQLQTAYRDSDDDEFQGSDLDWEAVDLEHNTRSNQPSGDLELNLTNKSPPQRRVIAPRRKAVSKEDRALRLQIHKLHVLCLLSYVDRRNDWCNDIEVQKVLRPLLTKKMLTYLRPKSDLSQFGQAESLKRGLEDVARMWRTKYSITARGMRRALWADNEEGLQDVCTLLIGY